MNTDRFKFRVWNALKNKYALYWELRINEDGELLYKGVPLDSNYIVEQCTGLKDKNGKLIFEGDILQVPGQTIAYKIQWGHHGFVVKAGFSSAKSYPMSNCEMFEIIGNIHDKEGK